jgi:AraC-like DNA-binding protein
MQTDLLDVAVRASGVTVMLLLAGMLFVGGRPSRLALWFAPLAACLSGFLIGNTPEASLRIGGLLGSVAHLASGYAGVCLWWFCLASFDRTFKPRGGVLAAGLAWIILASADRGVLGPALADKGLSWWLVALGFGIMLHLAIQIVHDLRGDLVEGRRLARVITVLFLAAQLVAELAKEVVFGIEWRPQPVTIVQNLALLVFSAWLTGLLLRPSDTQAEVLATEGATRSLHAAPPSKALDPDAGLAARLIHLVEVERVHLDPEMTLDRFVGLTGASERTVRRLIHDRFGHDHFREFLNAYRIKEARRRLSDPAHDGDKMIAIAADSGFASLASFNRVFRDAEGRTPGEYRRRRGAQPDLADAQPRLSGSEELFAGF